MLLTQKQAKASVRNLDIIGCLADILDSPVSEKRKSSCVRTPSLDYSD